MGTYYNKYNMSTFELLRNRIFFISDKLRGKQIITHLREIELFYKQDYKLNKQHTLLGKLLEDANANVNYYREYNSRNLFDLPVVDKTTIYKYKDDFISRRYDGNDLIKVSTSGSSGTPMTFYRNKQKQLRQIAEVLYFGKDVNYYLGRSHSFIRGISKGKMKLFLQNEVHIDPTHLDKDSLEEIRRKVKRTKFIIGFPSTITALVNYCIDKGFTSKDFKILGIITTSEQLDKRERKLISSFFQCDVVARYATEELGILGNQCISTENYHINESSFIVEVLSKETNEPVKPGEEGKIVVTDLFSNAMPLIRYDTGDYGTVQEGCSCGYNGKVLKTVSGRKIQTIYDYNGNAISPFAINVRMKEYSNVYQFQFIQTDNRKYKLLLVVNKDYNEEELIIKDFKYVLGDKVDILINYVDDVPPQPSGKRPYIINEMNI